MLCIVMVVGVLPAVGASELTEQETEEVTTEQENTEKNSTTEESSEITESKDEKEEKEEVTETPDPDSSNENGELLPPEEITEEVEEEVEEEEEAEESEEEEIEPFIEENYTMLVGVGKADITGPITGISTGYNSIGDLMTGLLTRLYARAFVVDNGVNPVVYVSAELVHMTESIKPGVMSILRKDGYSRLTDSNVMIAATHCHSSTSNVSWCGLYDLINGIPGYDDNSYQIIVRGIAKAIEQAYDSRVEGTVSFAYEYAEMGYVNRSADAFLQNVNVGDYGYEVDEYGNFSYETGLNAAQHAYNDMVSGLIFTDSNGRDIGILNFFGVHGTSNGIDNRLVASDHLGYAALKIEQKRGGNFVAAFAQADSGDTSPNSLNPGDYHGQFLRPADLSSTTDAIENQIVHGQKEASICDYLLNNSERIPLSDNIDFNYTAVKFSNIAVDTSYIGKYHMPYDDLSLGFVMTAEPCIGAAIIAGDEEGAPVDNAEEGTVRHQFVWNESTGKYDRIECDFSSIDLAGLEKLLKPLWPTAMAILRSNRFDDVQMEKVVCLRVSDLMQRAQPLQILRIGRLAIAGVPFELTYEQANRTRYVLECTLAQAGIDYVIIATHANAYSQYVTTREEYAAQHYEGSTCLFGPWSGAALTQELDKLAKGLVSGVKAGSGSSMMKSKPLGLIPTATSLVVPAADVNYGRTVTNVKKSSYKPGEWVTATFSAARPKHVVDLMLSGNELVKDYSYMQVQKKENGTWVTYLTDTSPYTIFCYNEASLQSINDSATVGWLIKGDTAEPGTYRLAYCGIAKTKVTRLEKLRFVTKTEYVKFTSYSKQFTVKES